MGKELTLTEETLQDMINKAVLTTREDLDASSMKVAGCEIKCIIEYEVKIRNEERNLISIKHFCMQHDMNSKNVFDILKDYGYLETSNKDSGRGNEITKDGFEALNGVDPQSTPFITSFVGTMYIDDKDDRLFNFISEIERHSLFKGKKYNDTMKLGKLKYTRRELAIAKELKVEIITVKELT